MADVGSEVVEVPAKALEYTLARLQERRVALERIVIGYGEAPTGIKEIFELCRGFERAYTSFINESPVAMKIKDCFSGEKGLAGHVRKLPFEKAFKLENVKSACRQADGYQPSLVAPEKGMRLLTSEALDFVIDPVNTTVQEVYNLLVNAGREAAEKAGQFTEAAIMGAMPMCVPNFKNVVMPAIVHALDEWKHEAVKMSLMLVDMERSYVTAGFFRHTQHHRYQSIKQAEQMRAAMQQKQMALSAKTAAGKGGGGGAAAKFFPSFGAAGSSTTPTTSPAGGNVADDDSDDGKSASKPSGGSMPAITADDFIAGYFEKYVSDDSARGMLLASMKWQRRFFVFSESQRVLYYFKGPEDVSKPNGLRGQINVAECIVEDLDDKGNSRPPGAPLNALMSADKAQLMIRIRHKDPRGSAVKDHNAIILRAENGETKLTWLAKLRKAAEPQRSKAAAGQQAAAAQPAAAGTPAEGGDGSPTAPAAAASPSSGTGAAAAEPGAAGTGTAAAAGAFGAVGAGVSAFAGSISLDGDLSWAKEAEPVLDSHLGQGSRLFRADNVRDSEGRLLPAPQQLLNPLRLRDYQAKYGASHPQAKYDALLDQFSSDLSVYMQCICDTICITVPKAIVHCMIRKSEKNLLERLFTVIHHLSQAQMETLLKEEDGVVLKRKAARAALEDCKTALFQVQQILERQNMANVADRKEVVTLPCRVFAYADMREHMTPDQVKFFEAAFRDPNAPETLRFGNIRLPPPPVAPQQPPRPGAPPPGASPVPAAGPGGGPPVPPRPAASPGGPGVAPSGPSVTGSVQRPPGMVPQRAPPGAPAGVMPQGSIQRRAPPPPPPGR